MAKRNWEVRVNGIRSSGDTFTSWEDAATRVFRILNQLHFEAADDAERARLGEIESRWIAEHARIRKERPLRDVAIKATRAGKAWHVELNRLPWGSAPTCERYSHVTVR